MHDWEKTRTEHGEIVWSIIFRILRNDADASDCYQEVFLEAFRKVSRGQVQNLPGLLRWLAVKRAIDLARRKSLDKKVVQIGLAAPSVPEIGLGNPLEFQELVERVRNELACIPPSQAEAFWMCCIEEISYREASEVMSVTASHVGVLVSRARKHLQAKLSDWNHRGSETPKKKVAFTFPELR